MKNGPIPRPETLSAFSAVMGDVQNLLTAFVTSGGFTEAKPAERAAQFIGDPMAAIHQMSSDKRETIAAALTALCGDDPVAEIFARGILDRLAADRRTAGPSPLADLAPRAPGARSEPLKL